MCKKAHLFCFLQYKTKLFFLSSNKTIQNTCIMIFRKSTNKVFSYLFSVLENNNSWNRAYTIFSSNSTKIINIYFDNFSLSIKISC